MINAADAMEERVDTKPRICLATHRDGDWVDMRVEDNGQGMDQETRDKVLDPFFTTKGAGKGTGLGLPLCYTVISEHGGTLEIDSHPGSGTCVTASLPIDERASGRGASDAREVTS